MRFLVSKISALVLILSLPLLVEAQTATPAPSPTTSSNPTLSPEELSQVNYLLYNYDCDINLDKVCDAKDQQLAQKQQQQQAGNNQIAQQLMGLGQQLLGKILGGNNKPPQPPTPAPNPPTPSPKQEVKPLDNLTDQAKIEEAKKALNEDRGKQDGSTKTPEIPKPTTTTTTSTTLKKKSSEVEKFDKLVDDPDIKKGLNLSKEDQAHFDSKYGEINLQSDINNNQNLKSGPFADSLNDSRADISNRIEAGELTAAEGAKIYNQNKLIAHTSSSLGEQYGSQINPVTNFQAQAKDFNGFINEQQKFLDQTLNNPATKANALSLVEQESWHAFDSSTIKQYGSTCFNCIGVQDAYKLGATEMTQMHHELFTTGSYKGITTSQLNFNPNIANQWTLSNGTAGIADQYNVTTAILGGDTNPWNGGYSAQAYGGAKQIVPRLPEYKEYSYNLNSQTQYINSVNQGKVLSVGAAPFDGHIANFNVLPSGNNLYVLGDGSWSPTNEVFHPAVASNADKLTFPGGYGGGGPGGLLGGLGGLGGFGNFGNNGAFNQGNQNGNTQLDPKKKQKLTTEYNGLKQAQKDKILQTCGQMINSGQGVASVCVVAFENLQNNPSAISNATSRISRLQNSARIDINLLKF